MSEEIYNEITSTVKEGLSQIAPDNFVKLAKWLLDNEGEIAYDLRGYGVLVGVFEDLIKRKPLKGNLGGTYIDERRKDQVR